MTVKNKMILIKEERMKMEIKKDNKKSKLCFDAKIVRKLLKMNGEIKFCPFCGRSIEDNCSCHKNIVIDIKPYRNSDTGVVEPDRSVFIFDNNVIFQEDYAHLAEEARLKESLERPEMAD